MVLWENDLFDICDHVVQVDFSKITCWSIIESRMEIFIADKYGECVARNIDGNNGMALLEFKD